MATTERTTHESTDYQKVPLAGGTLIYEQIGIGRELVGFADVDDWDDLADGLAARGHDRGAIYHLPTIDV